MGKKHASNLSVATFNVRGLRSESKQCELVADLNRYGVDICCLQETKISEDLDTNIENYRLINFQSNQKQYGNGFAVSNKLKIHRFWKVDDRISVIQIVTNEPKNSNQVDRYISSTQGTKVTIRKNTPKYLTTVINVYAPHSVLVAKNPTLLDDLYNTLATLVNSFQNLSSAMLLIAGDFNAKVGKNEGEDLCLGKFSRGRRNYSGECLVNFCEMHDLYICNSSFQHSARNITTWSKQYTHPVTKEITTSFSQIDFILVKRTQKHILTDARSYSGTVTFSDHRLTVARFNCKWFLVHKNRHSNRQFTPRLNNSKLANDKRLQKQYADKIQELIVNQTGGVTEQQNSKEQWKNLQTVIHQAAESTVGHEERTPKDKTYDEEIAKIALEKKNLRVKYLNCTDVNNIRQMKARYNRLSHQIRTIAKNKHEKRISDIVDEIEKSENSCRMFKAVKLLNRKALGRMFVYDDEQKKVTDPSEVHQIVREHFRKHFFKDNMEQLVIEPEYKPLSSRITAEEVSKASCKMSNGRSPGDDNVSVEQIKYAPDIVKEEIAKILNYHIENGGDLELGKGLIAALWKPNKEKGVVKNLRPVTLLKVIRKILSNITLSRIKAKISSYLSPSQSAYTNNRSTTDIVWAYKWILAKVQLYVDLKVFIVGTDLSSAFDTIDRQKLLQIVESLIDEDEMRMLKCLLSRTELELKMPDAKTEPFPSNVGSPQGDGISGPIFNVYFEAALREFRHSFNTATPQPYAEHQYTQPQLTVHTPLDHPYTANIQCPEELIYADDADFLTTDPHKKNNIIADAEPVLSKFNLNVNKSKTELTTLERGQKQNEIWRHVKKVGSLLGDKEDVMNRKRLARIQMSTMYKVWIQKNTKVSLQRRVTLYNASVKSVLLYNCATWGLTKAEEAGLNSFHRQQLRRLCNIKWPNKISSKEVYKKTKTEPVCIDITKARWKYFGHSLRMDDKIPAKQAMKWFFQEELNLKKHKGQQRTTIVSTLQKDIQETRDKFPLFAIRSLKNANDFEFISKLAADRKHWRRITRSVVDTAKAKHSLL